MPRKGRLVQPRHIFPWIAAPYIEMLRLLWRIERFFFMPIRYLQAWTVSAIFGVLGVFFSVALFIPRLTESPLQASPDVNRRTIISRHDMPYIPEEDLVLPPQKSIGTADLSFRMHRTRVEDFDQNEIVQSHSKPLIPEKSSIVRRDGWNRHRLDQRLEEDNGPLTSYAQLARVWDGTHLPLIPEYLYDGGVGDFRSQMQRSPALEIRKTSPEIHSPDEPLTYRITATNVGAETLESAIVEETVSDIRRVVDCDPRAFVSQNNATLIWDLSELQPKETRHINVTIRPDKRRQMAQTTIVSVSSSPVIGETIVKPSVRQVPEIPEAPPEEPEPITTEPTPISRPTVKGTPKLVLEFEPPSIVKVGEEVGAYYSITNVGTADATSIRLLVEVPSQLRHRYGELVEYKISRLAPNESRRALFAALAQDSGRMPLNWTLEAADLNNQSDSEWLAVLPGPRPEIESVTPHSTRSNEPTLVDDEPSPTPDDASPRSDRSSIPASGRTPSSIPLGPRPLTEPSSIPSWVNPGLEAVPQSSPVSDSPIDPELTPEAEENAWKIREITPPVDTLPLEQESAPLLPTTVPPTELPLEIESGLKEQ